MINNDKKSIKTKKIICLAIATSLAIITFLVLYFVKIDTFLYQVIMSFLIATLVFIGYNSSNIIEMGLSTCIFLFLGPILGLFIDICKYDMLIDDVPYLILRLCHNGVYIIAILISYFVGLYFKNKSKTKDLVIEIILINLGIIVSNILYNLCQVFIWSIVDEYNYLTSLGSFIWETFKYSPIIIVFVVLTLLISKLIFKKKVITNPMDFNEKVLLDNVSNVCRNCKTPLIPNSKFCTTCGTPIGSDINAASNMDENEILCNYCHKIISTDAKFCIHCGKPISK